MSTLAVSPLLTGRLKFEMVLSSQTKFFIPNASPTRGAVCRAEPKLSQSTSNYPSLPEFPIPWTQGYPQFPPQCFAKSSASRNERRLRRRVLRRQAVGNGSSHVCPGNAVTVTSFVFQSVSCYRVTQKSTAGLALMSGTWCAAVLLTRESRPP